MLSLRISSSIAALAALAALVLALAPSALAEPPASYPAAGRILATQVTIRAAPASDSRPVLRLSQFRRDFRPQIVLALRHIEDEEGTVWYELNLPMRPNGRTGWVRGDLVSLRPVERRIVIGRRARVLGVWQGERRIFRTRVAVGAPGTETPLGTFYVTAELPNPSATALGRYAIETSAYSKLSDWPGGGVVGIHGTYMPWLLGKAVSHGCVRVSNPAALALGSLVSPGTPIHIIP